MLPLLNCESNNNILEAALGYVDQGWAVLPLAPGGKEPFTPLLPKVKGKRTWKALAQRPATEKDVQNWFARYPDINIGIITGTASGLVVIDFDTVEPKGLPVTAMARTGRGLHAYLQAKEPYRSCKFDGGDIKAQGGYVVAPPSIHPDGSRYEWADYLSPEDADLEPYSDMMINRLTGISGLSAIGVASININSCYTPPANTNNKRTVRTDTNANPFIGLQKQDDVAFAVLQRFGVSVKQVGKPFMCLLPGHEEKNPSAALYRLDNGIIALKDFHRDAGCWLLPDVYAACMTGKVEKLKGGERLVWWLRCLADLGYIDPPSMHAHKLPDDAPESVKKLYKGFISLLALRTLYNSEQVGAPFSWRFAAGWCGISSHSTVQKAMRYLLERGYVYKIRNTESSKLTILALGKPRNQ